MSVTLSFRRCQFGTTDLPIAGHLVFSKAGRSVLKIEKVTTFRRAGEPATRDTIRLDVNRLSRSAVPDGASVLPWPIIDKVKATPTLPPVFVERQATNARATASVVGPKSRKQIKRDNANTLRSRLDDIESPVPRHQRNAVLARDGRVVSPPRVVSGSWRDPDDTNVRSRTPRLAHGFKPYDPIVFLERVNPDVETAHVVACNCYRLAHQLGPEAGFNSGKDMVFCDRQFDTSRGPTDSQIDHMAAWRWVQDKFLPREQRILQAVVLDRMALSTWSDKLGGNRQKWIGYLVNVLDRLLSLYRDDVDSFMRQERVLLD